MMNAILDPHILQTMATPGARTAPVYVNRVIPNVDAYSAMGFSLTDACVVVVCGGVV